jgi:hypothetical protein
MLGPNRGMGPTWLQGPDRLKKCDELHAEPCDPLLTDTCCAVIPCTFCLKWEVYGEGPVYGAATFDRDTGLWSGTIADAQFVAFWKRTTLGTCRFHVELDDEEIAVRVCSDEANEEFSCRKSGGSVETTISYDSGTLSWYALDKLPLTYVKTDAGCTDFFCGECECTCKVLCVTVRATINDESSFLLEGFEELTLDPYRDDCDGPEWSGVVTARLSALTELIDVSVYLYRDPYTGECWVSGTARGQELEPFRIVDCTRMQATFTLYDGSTVSIACKECNCETGGICEFCCLPLDFSNALYPNGTLRPIPYELTGCGEPITGNFTTSPGNLPCTEESVFFGAVWSTPSQPMFVNGPPDALGRCPTTPCFNTFTLILECTDRFSEPGDDSGCDRLWLWIGSVNKLVGDDGTRPPQNGLGGATSWIRRRATSCACDPVGGVSAVFSFSATIDCSDNPDGLDACYGIKVNCCEYSCDGTLII